MFQKLISRFVLTLLTGSCLYVSPLGVGQASAINNLMELFSRKSKPAPSSEMPPAPAYEAPTVQIYPTESQQVSVKKTPADITKRVVAPPKPIDYKPEQLIEIDFSNVDFMKTSSIGNSVSPIKLPLMPPYNVILEVAGSDSTREAATESNYDFSHINVKAEKSIVDAVSNYYTKNRRLIWSQNDEINVKAIEIMQFFVHLDEDGLEPRDYFVQKPDETLTGNGRTRALTNFDVALTSRILRYISDASNGRIIADRLSSFHDLPRDEIDFEGELQRLVDSSDPVSDLKSYLPQSDYYVALKKALADLPKTVQVDKIKIARQTVIKPGENNSSLPSFIALLQRYAPASFIQKHQMTLKKYENETVYNPALVDCVTDYQKRVGKNADGIIGTETIATLADNGIGNKRQRIIDSMERLRWLPHDFGKRYVLVNQAAFRAQYVENDVIKLDMKAVVGSPRKQTYFFYDKIRLVTFNPSWGVPSSIVVNEMLPRIMQDTNYLQRNNYQLYDSSGKLVSASSIDWQQVASRKRRISIRQTPGKNNALGELKILFPNKHDIYLHDTPNKAAFSRDIRALSHGCVRLEYPREMAAAVLGKSVKELAPYFSKGERSLPLSQHVPVYLAYFTAWPDLKTGQINYYDDIYNRDELMVSANEKTDAVRDNAI